MLFLRITLLLLLFSTAILSYGQTPLVRASADKNKILLGEPFLLTLEVKSLNGDSLPLFKIDNIEHFEFVTKDSVVHTQQGDTAILRQYFTLTSFDSGRWVIPPFTFRPFVKTNSVLIDVVFTDNFDPTKPYHDVQGIKDVPFKLDADLEQWWYPLFALLLLITLLIYWLTSPKKQVKANDATIRESAYKKATRSLKELREKNYDEKSYYAGLVEIFRTYIAERTGIESMQQTTTDLVPKLRPLFKDEVKYNSITQVLSLCDFVKFAKYHPQADEATSAYEVTEDAINYIETGYKTNNKK